MIDKHVALYVVIINELFLATVSLLPDFHRHRVCEPRFLSGIRSRLRGLYVAQQLYFCCKFTVSRLVNKFVLKN